MADAADSKFKSSKIVSFLFSTQVPFAVKVTVKIPAYVICSGDVFSGLNWHK
jgi:hypothetical protein